MAGAEVVNRHPCPGLPVARHHIAQALGVAVQFGDFKHNTFGRDAVLLQLFEAGQGLLRAQAIDPARGDIQAHKPVAGRFMQALQGVAANLPVQLAQGGCRGFWIGKQRTDRQQLAVALAQTPEGFDAGDTAGGGVDKGLETGERLPGDHGDFLRWRVTGLPKTGNGVSQQKSHYCSRAAFVADRVSKNLASFRVARPWAAPPVAARVQAAGAPRHCPDLSSAATGCAC